jgi:hypothetical protein
MCSFSNLVKVSQCDDPIGSIDLWRSAAAPTSPTLWKRWSIIQITHFPVADFEPLESVVFLNTKGANLT